MNTLISSFSEQSFMPHGHCYLWTPAMVWTQFLSNLSIGLAYVAISSLLLLFVLRAPNVPFKWVYMAFGVFIVSCGLTHFMDVLVIWQPRYWLDAGIRVITALASVGTALLLPKLMPQIMQVVRGAQLIRERGIALEAAVADLEAMNKKTRALDELKTTFFANVSHELRTPLTLILGPVEQLLRQERIDAEQRRELEVIARNARSLLRLVNNLLDLTKLDAGKLEPHYNQLDLTELIRFSSACFDSLARERQVDLTIVTPGQVEAQLDAEKVQRIVLNLLSNAFKFTPPGGSVRVELTAQRTTRRHNSVEVARIAVSDSGPGIPSEERAHIFERFRQGESAFGSSHPGTGLGLAMVREFATLHGGNVGVGDAAEGGAQFVVELPLRAPLGVRIHGRSQPSASLARTMVDELRTVDAGEDDVEREGDVPLVLIADDNDDMRLLLSRTLRPRYQIALAQNGLEALEKAQRLRPDLVLSDLMMPGMSGEELVQALRSVPALHSVPIVMLTAKSDEELRNRVLEGGAQDYLLKPFSSDELLARVHNLLTIKRTRDLLQSEVEAQQEDVEALSRQLVQQKRELSVALDTARHARHHAEQASRAKSDFLSLVSHELRTPLTSVQLQLERLRRGVLGMVTPEQVQVIDKMTRSSARLLDLLDALLEFGRIESGRLEVTLGVVDLAQLVRETVDELRPRAEQKNIPVRVTVAAEPLNVETDARLVRLIVINLVDNAIKYTADGAIEVQLEQTPDLGVLLRVIDTGPGIEPSQQELIFEPFQQLEHVRHKRGEGVGLGLALVRRIARALHAEIALESEVGRGSAFTITLTAA